MKIHILELLLLTLFTPLESDFASRLRSLELDLLLNSQVKMEEMGFFERQKERIVSCRNSSVEGNVPLDCIKILETGTKIGVSHERLRDLNQQVSVICTEADHKNKYLRLLKKFKPLLSNECKKQIESFIRQEKYRRFGI